MTVSVYCVPKIRAAYYYSALLLKKKDSNELLVNDLSNDKVWLILNLLSLSSIIVKY